MTDCKLFTVLSGLIADMIERSWTYYRPSVDGIPEPSLTDVILYALSTWARDVTIFVPDELTTGADLDIIIVDPRGKIFPFAAQSKKLKRSGHYHGINRSNTRGYQADLLCSRPPFFPLYLFYNYRHVGVPRGCAIANGHLVRNLALGYRGTASDLLSSSVLGPHQIGWEALVCPSSSRHDLTGLFQGADDLSTGMQRPQPVDIGDLPPLHQALLKSGTSRPDLADSDDRAEQGPIIVVRLNGS